MAKINFNNFKKNSSDTTYPGLSINSPLVVDNGVDGSIAVLANQIYWGTNSEILGQQIAAPTSDKISTYQFFEAIEKGVDNKISNIEFPGLTVKGNFSATAGKYISGISVNGHEMTVSQSSLPSLKWTDSEDADKPGYFISKVNVSGHTMTPVYAYYGTDAIVEQAEITPSSLWADF